MLPQSITMISQLIDLGVPIRPELITAGQIEVGLINDQSQMTDEQRTLVNTALDLGNADIVEFTPPVTC
jgi:hypothetical protein